MTRASPDPKLAKRFFNEISKLRENHDFEDFKVIIEGDIFPCHSFILASYSEFFKLLLRSDMKEKREMAVELKNISSPIFRLVLNSLYTGCELLTKENIIEVWSAVHQLQIHLLIEHCEDFVIEHVNLDTVDSYKRYADLFQSQKVCEFIFTFMLKNFESLRDKEIFFQMNFQSLKRLLESDQLDVKSEDIILDSVFKWVNYTHISSKNAQNDSNEDFINTLQDIEYNEINEVPKKENSSLEANHNAGTEEQKKYYKNPNELIQLLKSTRYYLASENCILNVLKHNLVQNDIFIKEIFVKALIFKLSDHGHCPTAAIHRNCSDLEHVGVFCDQFKIKALSLKRTKWFLIEHNIKTLKYSKLIVFKGNLYACSIGSANNKIYVLNKNCWEQVTVLKRDIKLFIAHEQSFYMLDSIEKVFIKFNPGTSPIQLETISYELHNPEFALSFHNNIIVFCSVDNNGIDETAVHSWNTENNEWIQLNNLEFSSKNMSSFRDDLNTYILDSNGSLWKLTNTEVISFTFVAKLWSVKCDLRGAILFRKTLYIFGNPPDYFERLEEVEGVFSDVRVWISDDFKTSNFVHYAIPKCELKPRHSTHT